MMDNSFTVAIVNVEASMMLGFFISKIDLKFMFMYYIIHSDGRGIREAFKNKSVDFFHNSRPPP